MTRNASLAPPADVMAQFALSDPQFIAETSIARVWKVQRASGDAAALKVYTQGDMKNEATGFAFLSAMEGKAAARVYGQTASAALVEWLPGPSLGDLSRNGQDADAALELAHVANALHAVPPRSVNDWPTLDAWFVPLFDLCIAHECSRQTKDALTRAQDVARSLLSNQRSPKPLHGDLHHDNVRLTSRGYCAFDAKGVVGDRAYELANAFRNPKGIPDVIRDPSRIRYLRDLWSDILDVDAQALMGWAVAKTALSVAWRSGGTLIDDPELDLLAVLIAVHDAQ